MSSILSSPYFFLREDVLRDAVLDMETEPEHRQFMSWNLFRENTADQCIYFDDPEEQVKMRTHDERYENNPWAKRTAFCLLNSAEVFVVAWHFRQFVIVALTFESQVTSPFETLWLSFWSLVVGPTFWHSADEERVEDEWPGLRDAFAANTCEKFDKFFIHALLLRLAKKFEPSTALRLRELIALIKYDVNQNHTLWYGEERWGEVISLAICNGNTAFLRMLYSELGRCFLSDAKSLCRSHGSPWFMIIQDLWNREPTKTLWDGRALGLKVARRIVPALWEFFDSQGYRDFTYMFNQLDIVATRVALVVKARDRVCVVGEAMGVMHVVALVTSVHCTCQRSAVHNEITFANTVREKAAWDDDTLGRKIVREFASAKVQHPVGTIWNHMIF